MKKFLIALGVVSLVVMAGCSKNHSCRCVTNDGGPEAVLVVNLDRGMSCGSITRQGFEKEQDGKLVRTIRTVTCEKTTEE